MCRLLGIVASETTPFHFSLHEAPRSLARLSHQHPHGWGIATYQDSHGRWTLHKHPCRADGHELFHDVATASRGEVLVAHIRQATVGSERHENTHPFQRDRWIFAHNGTIRDLGWLRGSCAQRWLGCVEGETDSEVLFTFVLSALDRAGARPGALGPEADEALASAVGAIAGRSDFGASNFLLSDGETLYAHRRGRDLYLLERTPDDALHPVRESAETGGVVETRWSAQRTAILVASERISDEPWQPVEEGALMRVDRRPRPTWRRLR